MHTKITKTFQNSLQYVIHDFTKLSPKELELGIEQFKKVEACGIKNIFQKSLEKTLVTEHGNEQTPLLFATSCDKTEHAIILIDNGADVNKRDAYPGQTPLMNAVLNKNKILIAKLLQHPQIDFRLLCTNSHNNHYAKNILHIAINIEDYDTTRQILKLSGDKAKQIIDHQNNSGSNALMAACIRAPLDIIKIMIDKGAEILIADQGGYTPMSLAQLAKRQDVIDLLANSQVFKTAKPAASLILKK